MDSTPEANKTGIGDWRETLKTIAYALAIALFVRTLLYQPFNIPSGSMKPTLLVGDSLFASKFAYGYSRYSLPFGLVPFRGRLFGGPPRAPASPSPARRMRVPSSTPGGTLTDSVRSRVTRPDPLHDGHGSSMTWPPHSAGCRHSRDRQRR